MTGLDTVLTHILSRRSIRFGFEDRHVPRDVLQEILACGLAAPSSKNAQPWRFHVVSERSAIDQLSQLVRSANGSEDYVPHDPRTGEPFPQYKSTVLDSAETLLEVPATIWVENLGAFSAGRKTLLSVGPEVLADSLVGYGFELLGIGAAVENMWIAANALGLAATFMGDVVIAEPEIRQELGIEGDLLGVLALGYSSVSPPPPMDTRAFAGSDRVVWH